MSTAANSLQAQQAANANASSLIQKYAVEMTQQIFSQTITPSNGNVITVVPKNVGLIKYFIIELTATVSNTSAAALSITDFGPANLLSQITFTDLFNNTRHQTTGMFLNAVNSAKSKKPYGSAYVKSTGIDSPINYGSNWGVISAPSTIATSASGTVKMFYVLPISYSDTNYKGAIWANVVNATMQMQLTVNPTPCVASTADSTFAIYSGNAAASLSSVTATVYQVYMDQLPAPNGQVILPQLDLQTSYELKNTTFSSIVQSQDFGIQYSNFRSFLSTTTVYYNGTNRSTGSDINYWQLLAANQTPLWKYDPYVSALKTRHTIGCDFPPGMYYHSSRMKPIITTQFGNIQLVLNASTAGTGAYVLCNFEDFANIGQVANAQSLASS